MLEDAQHEAIAVVGMAGRFPGAPDVEQFWQNLLAGESSFSSFDDAELIAAGVTPGDLRNPNYVKVAPVIDEIDQFDAAFFGVSTREAEVMDPQHRVLLETCHVALQRAGYDGCADRLRIGMFAGSRKNEYVNSNLSTNPGIRRAVGELALLISNDTDYLATGVAYRLNLRGPAVTAIAACSTSLVSVHLACQSLHSGDCDLALAGGVEIPVPMIRGYLYMEGGINSPDGQVRPFDANARGTVFGSGCGVVALKRLGDALADGDTIQAVIRGTAINNDGSGKSVFTAPGKSGQVAVIQAALRDSGVDPGTIGFVEAHGTGTIVGDPIEIDALTEAYRSHTERSGYCAIASVKGNVGHLGAAAGICGFIKAARCVSEGLIPASLNFDEPNPAIDFAASPFYVNTALRKWPDADGPRRAGVSAFGVGGTNAHVIIESPPSTLPAAQARRPYQLLAVSARTESALDALTAGLGEHLAATTGELADAAYTLNVGRAAHQVRRIVLARDCAEAADRLSSPGGGPAVRTLPAGAQRSAAFLFPGQGAQYAGMARDLYATEAGFAAEIDRCATVLAESHRLDLASLLFGDEADAEAAGRLDQTAVTQPALFAVEYALARLLQQWGVEPAAMAGHSVGEYVAASLAGVIDPYDALRLVADRGAFMQAMPSGSMLAVMVPEELLLPMLPPTVDLAAVNGPGLCVVSGPDDDIAGLQAMFARQGIGTRPVRTSHAFHSRMMDPILEQFRERVGSVTLGPPQIPYVSNLTGTWIRAEEATDPEYWVRHLRCCVRFSDTLRLLVDAGGYVFAEIGPGRTLTGLVAAHAQPAAAARPASAAVPTMRRADEGRDDTEVLLESLGQLWAAGAPVDWARFWSGERRRRVALPPYPYERRRFWVERNVDDVAAAGPEGDAGPFYVPAWRESPLDAHAAGHPVADAGQTLWVVFSLPGDPRIGELVRLLRSAGADVIVTEPGNGFAAGPGGRYELRADEPADYAQLFSAIAATSPDEVRLVHAWTAGEPAPVHAEAARTGETLDHGFFSMLAAVQAAARQLAGTPVEACIVTSGMQDVTGSGRIEPAKAAVLGLVKVAAKECDGISCRSVDIDVTGPPETVAAQLLAETAARPGPEQVAYRGRKRWTWSYAPVHPEAPAGTPAILKDRGVYVISGGLGGLGLVLAEQLARLARARLVLLGRSALPDRDTWPALLADAADGDPVVRRLRAIQAIEQSGGEVLALAADVTDEARMRAVRAETEAAFGPVDGVFHLAAVAGGGMLEARSRQNAEEVLRPKVAGTYVLDDVFRPDLFVLYSSTAVIAGDFGLGDYAGANAVLDAFAQARWGQGRHVVSINWPAWYETGMASEGHGVTVLRDLELGQASPVAHPMLRARRGEGTDVTAFDVELDPALWVFAEHRMNGTPSMPGTGIVELIRAAFEEITGSATVEIRDLIFPKLLTAEPGIEARAELRRTPDGGFTFTLTGGRPSRPAEQYARGRAYPVEAGPVPHHDLAFLRNGAGRDTTPPFQARIGVMEFGPRWDAIRSRYAADGLDLLDLRLSEDFAADTDRFRVHPALLDAAGAVGMSRPTEAEYMPFGYDRIVVRGAVPPECHSVIRHLDDTRGELTRVDLTIVGEDGAELVAVEGYGMLRVSADGTPSAVSEKVAATARTRAPAVPRAAEDPVVALIRDSNSESVVSSAEGSEALRIVLADGLGPQVILCPGGIADRVRRAGRLTRSVLMDRLSDARAEMGATRSLATPYAAPESDTELAVAELWRDSIGIDQVGIDDDFLDLGGDSLLAVQLVGRITQRFGTDVSVAQLFEHRTVRALAASIQQSDRVPADSLR
ncbi:MAG TPA: beta-ketoacyl synthase N-terminal-like domain-containing protein [Streptosporangiaceae bacterium]|nr:beta-ketoacyl synthase N-terminal-like domain-containing protein [Streptosporangiaceae bacterium]